MTFFTSVMSCFTVVLLPVAWMQGEGHLAELLAAVGICWGFGLVALGFTHRFSLRGNGLAGLLIAMACRLAPPLLVCLWLALKSDFNRASGFIGYLVLAYLVALAAETYISVQLTGFDLTAGQAKTAN